MKNQNQAEVKASKPQSVTPSSKRSAVQQDIPPFGQALGELAWAAVSSLAPSSAVDMRGKAIQPRTFVLDGLRHPFGRAASFEIILDWISNTMEPEVFEGNRAMVIQREDMSPCAGELVVGLLKTGELVFGAHEIRSGSYFQISYINPIFGIDVYSSEDFLWLYPVAFVSVMSDSNPPHRKLMKKLEFFSGDE